MNLCMFFLFTYTILPKLTIWGSKEEKTECLKVHTLPVFYSPPPYIIAFEYIALCPGFSWDGLISLSVAEKIVLYIVCFAYSLL